MDKDGTSTIPNDPVAGLIDIPLPQAISLWPATSTSRIAIVLLIVGLIATIIWFMRRWHANRYRRAALAELDGIVRSPMVDRDPVLAIDNLALLVRRTALVAYPRERIAPLNGVPWLDFLDRSYAGHEFSRCWPRTWTRSLRPAIGGGCRRYLPRRSCSSVDPYSSCSSSNGLGHFC